MNDPVESVSPSAPPPAAPVAERPPHRAWQNPWLIVALLALGLAGWQWLETRMRIAETQQELARRLSDSDTLAKESRALSRQAQEQLGQLQAKLGELEGKLAESKSQQTTLENLYQDLARNRDEWVLAEVEQGVTLASQQLQLAANVQGAIVALQTADARLAGSGRPQLLGLRKALARDLERLRALPMIDLAGMSVRLESVIPVIDSLPLAVDVRPHNPNAVADEHVLEPSSGFSWDFFRHLATDLWSELRALIRVQRFDRDEPALLAPGQSFFLRENLKLRLLSARLALLSRDQWVFRSEIRNTLAWLDRYFDAQDKAVQTARATLKQLAGAEINIDLPTVNDSLSAIKSMKLAKERT